ncbi:MAG: hypothetical protein M5U34_14920 [Chloroflexi bacterium]|nr:hypothetical protein [Chloroflexota bacterium]
MFYIFHGDDSHSQKEYLAKITARFGDPGMLDLNTTRYEGYVSFRDLSQTCDALPFLAPVRLVVAEGLLSHLKEDGSVSELLASLLARHAHIRPAGFHGVKRNLCQTPAAQLAESAENGYVKSFSLPKDRELEKWIQKRAGEKGGTIALHAVHMLAINIGSNLALLDNEPGKLILYKGAAKITADDVALLFPYLAEASIFDLVDAVGKSEREKGGPAAATEIQRWRRPVLPLFHVYSPIPAAHSGKKKRRKMAAAPPPSAKS